eukprot:358826-Chlamydomonas_euryale.AAC.10
MSLRAELGGHSRPDGCKGAGRKGGVADPEAGASSCARTAGTAQPKKQQLFARSPQSFSCAENACCAQQLRAVQ